jgi:hypothetical protein
VEVFYFFFGVLIFLNRNFKSIVQRFVLQNIQNQLIICLMYYSYFSFYVLPEFSIEAIFCFIGFFFCIQTLKKFERLIGLNQLFVWIYVHYLYFISYLICINQIQGIFLIFIIIYVTLYIYRDKIFSPSSENYIQHYYNVKFGFLSNIKKYIFLIAVIISPILMQILLSFWFNLLVLETSSLLFYILITMFFLSLVNLLIIYAA